jgi:hypothetical protein
MDERVGGSSAGLAGDAPSVASERLGEDRAREILSRAAALDAKRSSELDVGQLREAASAAGISAEAFDEAVREHMHEARDGAGTDVARAPRAAEVAHFGGLLRDLLGDNAEILVVGDRIEGRDGRGLTISIDPHSRDAKASLVAEGSLERRLVALTLPATLPGFLGFLLMLEEGDPGIGMMLGVLFGAVASGIGLSISYVRERKALRRKVERIRRQLQRMLTPGDE